MSRLGRSWFKNARLLSSAVPFQVLFQLAQGQNMGIDMSKRISFLLYYCLFSSMHQALRAEFCKLVPSKVRVSFTVEFRRNKIYQWMHLKDIFVACREYACSHSEKRFPIGPKCCIQTSLRIHIINSFISIINKTNCEILATCHVFLQRVTFSQKQQFRRKLQHAIRKKTKISQTFTAWQRHHIQT